MTTDFTEGQVIWKNGELIAWQDAQIHVLSTAVQFGSSVFEGIRCYETERGPAIFRLQDHIGRLANSCKIYRMAHDFSADALEQACVEAVRANELSDCYIRPTIVRGYGSMGLAADSSPIEVYVPAWRWGAYLGADALERGIDVCVSSWSRPAPNTFPAMAKAAGHYNSSQLIKWEAMQNGYAEGIALGVDGRVSEGSGQNLFAVVNGTLITPAIDGSNLQGITRDTVIRSAESLGIDLRIAPIPREMLYCADELFFTGTASEVTPIASVDRIPVGTGKCGKRTREIQNRYFEIVTGRYEESASWLTYVRN